MSRGKKSDYECRVCGVILTDKELDGNGEICNDCLLDKNNLYIEEEDFWEEYK